MEKSNKVERRVSSFFERFGLVLGIVVGLVALVIGLLSYLAMGQKTEIAAQVLACDELTTYHPELEAKFIYAGEEVAHLWKLKVKFVNSGDKTIVGMGNQANIIGEGLNFMFPEDTKILRVEEEADTFQSDVAQLDVNKFQIQFSQWRSGEYMISSFYVASEQPLAVDPCPAALNRDIIDGDVVVQDLTKERPSEQMSLIDRLPRPMSLSGKIMGGISAGVLTLLFIITLIWAWIDTVKKFTWEKRYLSSFRSYLDHIEPALSKSIKRRYENAPETLPDNLWANFEGKKASWSLDFPNKPAGTVITIILAFAVFGLSCLILMLFPV